MDNYIVIAYKPSNEVYSMSCLVASYSSDFAIENFEADYFEEYCEGQDTRDHALTNFAKYLILNEFLEGGEAHYDVTVFKNGTENVTSEFFEETKEEVQRKINEKKEEQRLKKDEIERKRQIEKESIERKKLAELKEKYEKDVDKI